MKILLIALGVILFILAVVDTLFMIAIRIIHKIDKEETFYDESSL